MISGGKKNTREVSHTMVCQYPAESPMIGDQTKSWKTRAGWCKGEGIHLQVTGWTMLDGACSMRQIDATPRLEDLSSRNPYSVGGATISGKAKHRAFCPAICSLGRHHAVERVSFTALLSCNFSSQFRELAGTRSGNTRARSRQEKFLLFSEVWIVACPPVGATRTTCIEKQGTAGRCIVETVG